MEGSFKMTDAIPCVIQVQQYVDGQWAPSGFGVLWVVMQIEFDARQSPYTCCVGDRARVLVTRGTTQVLYDHLVLTSIEATDRPHVFHAEAVSVQLCLLSVEGDD